MNGLNKVESNFRVITPEEEKIMGMVVADVVEVYLKSNQRELREHEVHSSLLKQVRKEEEMPELKNFLMSLAKEFFKKNNQVPSADKLLSIAKSKDKLDEEKEEKAA